MPAVMGMAGNSGLQTSTLMIRNLVTGPSLRDHLWQLIRREMGVALVIGLVCGLSAGIMAQVLFEGGIVGLVVGLAMFISILFSTCLGIILPLLLDKTGIDPAVASGPLIATLNDSTAITIYLGLGTLLLHFLH
jgi:magnesium transporter